MAIVTYVTSVSYRYYEKRNRSVAELNIIQMCQSLKREPPADLRTMPKSALIRLALNLHDSFPETADA
jgi:hypothetical protein